MEVIGSSPRTAGRDFQDNQTRMKALTLELKERLARERIDGAVDDNTPFLELIPPAVWGMYDGEVASAGIITSVAGVPALSIPCGFSAENLPLSLQLVGKPMADGLLLRVAQAYQ